MNAAMNIALISYEYPPDTADGGIATYVGQAAQMLASRGHRVEVFCASRTRAGSEHNGAIRVHRIWEADRAQFPLRVGPVFAARHREVRFDVTEGPEYMADAREAIRLVPAMPLVVKLHTPCFLLREMNLPPLTPLLRARARIAQVRRGIRPFWEYDAATDIERFHTLQADEVAAPSRAVGNRLTRAWRLDATRVFHVPYPYIPAPALLEVPVETHSQTVTFVGRLETRKGVLDLARAIPRVLQKHPQAKFRFVGKALLSPRQSMDMAQYLRRELHACADSIEISPPVALDQIPRVLSQADICVFPSLWESFGLVCLEAMAAARGVIASDNGGMYELLDAGRVGRVTPPAEPRQLAYAIIELLEYPEERMRLGIAARARVLSEYSSDRIGALQEASYHRAIARRRALGPRRANTSISANTSINPDGSWRA